MSRISGASQAEIIRPIHGSFLTSKSEIVRLGRRIGIGAEGAVHEIRDQGNLVAKVYHEPPPEKGEKLVVLSRLGADRLFNLSAWPVDVLRDAPGGSVVGFLMKRISGAEEVHTLHSPRSRLQKFPEASWAFLIYVAANIARAVATIHEHGLVIGDVNPKNILVTRKATVYLLDVDSFQVSADGKTYRCDGGFPEYTPPELQGVAFRDVDRAQEHDYFGLAVVIFQLLFMGRHPFSGRYLGAGEMPLERAIREFRFAYGVDAEAREMRQPPGALALDSIPAALVDLFRRAFLTTDRPQPGEWIEQLDALAKALKKCDLHSGHYYYRELRDCPWCGIESRARVRLFNFLLPGDDSRRGHFRLDEIWKDIESVETPRAPLIQWDKLLKAPAPSAEAKAFAEGWDSRFTLALVLSGFVGLVIPLLVPLPLAIALLILAGLGADAFAKGNPPFLENIRERRRQAREKSRRIQEQYDSESENEHWDAKRSELRHQKETYENLARIRQLRLQQLEVEARKDQLDEFLDQFGINDADIYGISNTIKTVLLSHGVETAADVGEVKELKQIPSIGRLRAKWLLEWRRDLEQKFVFDPVRSVPHEARIRIEREVDELRFRLETELSGGSRHLRQMKQEIENIKRNLQPALAQARQEIAQAEKDLEVASKRNPTRLIMIALIVTFIIGLLIRPSNVPAPTPGPVSGSESEARAKWESKKKASELYIEGALLSKEGKFEDSVVAFREAVRIDPMRDDAHRELGYALYRLKRYEESVVQSEKAIELRRSFMPYYNMGLAYMELKRWDKAQTAFYGAQGTFFYPTDPISIDSWEERHTLAFYYLARSQTQLGNAEQIIDMLEDNRWVIDPKSFWVLRPLHLGCLYLWVGKRESAIAQYEILKMNKSKLAEELMKLIKKHGKPA
ncbi:MAG TPA: tetratricopeptide repeat protein [Blastocatellia bacterium]|nr:tetratricopeptide repeat protein [Blastocatellia bacterium]